MKLKGQTLIETLVSLALLGLLFMLGLTLIGQLQGPNSPPQVHQARSLARAFLHEPIEGRPTAESQEAKAFRLERSITAAEYHGLYEVSVRVFRGEQEVLVVRRFGE